VILATVWEAIRTVSPFVVVGGGFLTWWLRDRKKDRAAASVAEQTVPADVAVRETGAAEARLVYVQREMDAERHFHQQQLADRDAEIERQRKELSYRDRLIRELRDKVADLETQLEAVTQQLTSVRNQLNELADHDDA
jgi:septal ring factor EnvC (AmiA/AmiB activator)